MHCVAGEETIRWRWSALLERALEMAALLEAEGVSAGQTCALIMRHHHEFYPLYMAVVALGALPAVLAYPNARLHPDKFRHGLIGMAERSGLDWILTERTLEPVIAQLVGGGRGSVRGLLFPLQDGAQTPGAKLTHAREAHPDGACLLQHSSGTTGLQKAVVLSHRDIIEHARRYAAAIDMQPTDRVVSWLPLYHDMGLIAAFHIPLLCGVPTVQLDPFEWVVAPVLLLDTITRERATLCWQPNFAYNMMADRIRDEDLDGVSLDSVRMLVNCSEPVRADSHTRFLARFSSYGLRDDALAASYAMAEATFCVTQTPPGTRARQLRVSRQALTRGEVEEPESAQDVRECVSSGQPISGCEVVVLDADGRQIHTDRVGELYVRSVSLFGGYRNNPEATAAALRGGWYATGDLGFMHDGQCYVVGRRKDIIIVAGKNLYPEDIEDAVSEVPGIQPGRVVAFGVAHQASGTEQIWVVAETETLSRVEEEALRLSVVRAGMAIDVTISQVHFVPGRWLVKSSAGKPSRSANRERILLENLTPVGSTTL